MPASKFINSVRNQAQNPYAAVPASPAAGYGNTPYGGQITDVNQYGTPYNYAAPYTAHQYGVIGDTTMNENKSAQINQMAALNPAQVQMQNAMIDAYMRGSGEFGFGGAAKSANATMEKSAAMRGIDPRSGVTQSLLARMYAEALAADAQRRQQYGMDLMQSSPAYYNALQMQLGNQQQGAGFGDFAGQLLGTGIGYAIGGPMAGAAGGQAGSKIGNYIGSK